MNSHKPGLERLWRTDARCIWAMIRALFKGPLDFLILAGVAFFLWTYLSTTVEKVERLGLGIEALLGVLILWPMSFKVTSFLIKRVTWYREQTALSAVALQPTIPILYVSLPLMLACGIAAAGVLRMMPATVSSAQSGTAAAILLVIGISHALFARTRWEPAKRMRSHPEPGKQGAAMLTRSVMRFQLFGLQPKPLIIASLLIACFGIASAIILAFGNRAGDIAASAFICLVIFIIARPSYSLSRCAAQAGYRGRTLAKAHIVLPLMIQATAIIAAVTFVRRPSEFIVLSLVAFLLATVPTIVRALRYASAPKYNVEIRLFLEMVLVAMVSTPLPWAALPGVAIVLIVTVVQYRRNRWRIT